MPLKLVFITDKHSVQIMKIIHLTKYIVLTLLTSTICACGALRWHSVEEMPAESIAYIRDGVFVSGNYIRSATIVEIDGKKSEESNQGLHEINIGTHEITIYCDEAEGEFDSNELTGKSRILKFEAQIQRTYLVRCEPFTHWWIEDSENQSIVAGEKNIIEYE